jgi:hypothetical protein
MPLFRQAERRIERVTLRCGETHDLDEHVVCHGCCAGVAAPDYGRLGRESKVTRETAIGPHAASALAHKLMRIRSERKSSLPG